ncbi:MAG TPA: ABC transporter ATP-binding protein, partial [Candidatus Saccharimonadales bacterium]|nr:ABC transporter ATP-binding protein [Candidatus Saccharimonadales bacterium]
MSASPGRIAPKRRPGRRLAAAPVAGSTSPRDADDGSVRIRTRGLTKHYGDLVAVDHLDLEVRAGEIFGLLGQNGAGKTTTILMLLGLTEPTEGTARVVGLDPTRGPLEVKRRVGYMPDSVGFYGDMTGRENLRYTARLNRVDRAAADATIGSVLDQVGLADRADDPVDTYSRGMLQRLGIADALVKDPDVLILDEPTTAIDPLGVGEVLDLLRSLVRERGMAILLSSHLLNQVQSVCDRIGIFAAGRLIGQGTMADLASRFGDGAGHLEVGFEPTDEAGAAAIHDLLAGIDGVTAVTAGVTPSQPWTVSVGDAARAAEVRTRIFAIVA